MLLHFQANVINIKSLREKTVAFVQKRLSHIVRNIFLLKNNFIISKNPFVLCELDQNLLTF